MREDLFAFIEGEISFELGFELFRVALAARGIEVNTWKELNKLYPDLTVLEISLVSLLQYTPRFYLASGKNGISDLVDIPMPRGLEDRCGENVTRSLVASLYQATPFGLGYIFDSYDQKTMARDSLRMKPLDAYTAGGITGMHEEVELVPFRRDIAKAFERLILLVISNKLLHCQIFRESDECFTAAFGVVLRKAYERALGRAPIANRPIDQQLDELAYKERMAVRQKADELERHLCNAKIYDLTMGRLLTSEEVFRLAALLEKPPEELFDEKGFSGYCGAYGLGVRFISENGQVISHSPYRGFFVQRACNIVYAQQVDIEKQGGVASEIFERVYEQQIAKATGNVITEGAPTSRLEELRLDVFIAAGIDLAIYPREYVKIHEANPEVKNSELEASLHVWGGEKQVQAYSTIKIGYNEARLIVQTLKLLPRGLLAHVKRIEKDQESALDLESIMSGMVKQGRYCASTKTITMLESASAPFNTLTSVGEYVYITTLLHEVGESIWANLTPEQREEFTRIIGWSSDRHDSKHGVSKDDLRAHFLSAYSHLSGPNDDFAEHFLFYVMNASEFRDAAAKSEPLRRKYEFLKTIFTTDGKAIEYPALCDLTIEEIHGDIDKEIKREDMMKARELQELEEERLFEERSDRIADIKRSWDEMDEAEQEIADREDDLVASENNPFFSFRSFGRRRR